MIAFLTLFAALEIPPWLAPLRKLSAEEVLLPVLVQLIIIILVARVFAALARKVGQPSVVGEIAAGLILGPSVLGYFYPEMAAAIFHPGLHGVDPALADSILNWVLTTLSHIGLILLLFLIGLEFDFSHLKLSGKSAVAISISGVALPFVLGLGVAHLLLPYIEPHDRSGLPVDPLGFSLFLGTALSITAIPVLGRIMMEMNITRTRLGAITISAAAVDDASGWILLATVAAITRGNLEWLATGLMIAETIGFTLLVTLVGRPILRKWAQSAMRRGRGEIGMTDLAVLIALMFGCAIVTNLIGIFAIFGAFILGATLSFEHEFREAVIRRLRDFVTVFFLPIFFTFTGLRTDVDTLGSVHLWMLCGLVLVAGVVGKLVGCGAAAYATGMSLRESACVGSMMNARGLMELIAINVGYELGVIPKSVFAMLVIMALATTVMTSPLLIALMKGTEIEPYVLASGFIKKRRSKGSPPAPETAAVG